jgi:glucokinase
MTEAIGIDVGGTKIAAGIVDEMGALRGRKVLPTRPQRGGRAVFDDAFAIACELLADVADARIGIAVAELVSPEGRILSETTIQWRGIPILEEFTRLAPTVVEADTRAGALGEAVWGAGRSFKNFYYLTVGTGIGGSLVIGRKPFAGARGCAGVVSIPLERIAAGPALVARYGRAAERGEDVTAAAERGEPVAVEIVRSAAEALGAKAGEIVNLLDPEAVVVGGGLGTAGGLYWETFVAATRRHVWSETNRGLPILRSERGGDATLVGAAAAALGEAVR